MDRISTLIPIAMLIALGACQTTGDSAATAQSASTAASSPQMRIVDPTENAAPAFVQAACGGCHAVEEPWISPNPQAPTFAEVVSKPGVSGASLSEYLADAHNYPEQMDFDLEEDQVELLVGYMGQISTDMD
jgi:cytochrome c553